MSHEIVRVRHETRRRVLTVDTVETLTPKMLRLHLTSDEMDGFASASPDDHIKLFFPADGPTKGPVPGYHMRDYTPRAFDVAAGTLVLDFAVHEAGPATAWAMAAKPGDTLEIGGPRGSAVITDDFDWYCLIGDETALPAICRRIEGLRPGVRVTSLVVVDGEAEAQSVETRADWRPVWLSRRPGLDDTALILEALAHQPLPDGEGFVWIAAEADVARAVRTHILDVLGHPKAWTKVSGYWLRGGEATDAKIDD